MHPSPGGDVGDDALVLQPSVMCASLKRVLPDSVVDVVVDVSRSSCQCGSRKFQQEHVARPHQSRLNHVPPWPRALRPPFHVGLVGPCRQDVRNTLRPRHAPTTQISQFLLLNLQVLLGVELDFSPLPWPPLPLFAVRGGLRQLTRAPPPLRRHLVRRFPHRLRHPC